MSRLIGVSGRPLGVICPGLSIIVSSTWVLSQQLGMGGAMGGDTKGTRSHGSPEVHDPFEKVLSKDESKQLSHSGKQRIGGKGHSRGGGPNPSNFVIIGKSDG